MHGTVPRAREAWCGELLVWNASYYRTRHLAGQPFLNSWPPLTPPPACPACRSGILVDPREVDAGLRCMIEVDADPTDLVLETGYAASLAIPNSRSLEVSPSGRRRRPTRAQCRSRPSSAPRGSVQLPAIFSILGNRHPNRRNSINYSASNPHHSLAETFCGAHSWTGRTIRLPADAIIGQRSSCRWPRDGVGPVG